MEPDGFLMRQAEKQGRYLAMHISVDDLISLFNWSDYDTLRLPVPIGKLEGARCVSIHDDPTWRGLKVIFVHPRFEPVTPGCKVPEFNYQSSEWRVLRADIVAKGYVDAEARQAGSGSTPAPPSERELEAQCLGEKPGWPYT